MVASIFQLFDVGYLLFSSPFFLLITIFQVWMFIDAIRRQEYIWAAFIFIGSGISTLLYYLFVYRAAPSATRGFELPGAVDRRRIKDLQAKIHHLDKAHHHSQLGDIYFQQGKLNCLSSLPCRDWCVKMSQTHPTRQILGLADRDERIFTGMTKPMHRRCNRRKRNNEAAVGSTLRGRHPRPVVYNADGFI